MGTIMGSATARGLVTAGMAAGLALAGATAARADTSIVLNAGKGPVMPTTGVTLMYGYPQQFHGYVNSGAPLTFAITGPCSITQAQGAPGYASVEVTPLSGTGSCILEASAPATATEPAATQTFALTVTPAAQSVPSLESGVLAGYKIVKGRTYLLGPKNLKTIDGNRVTFAVTGGSSTCSIMKKDGKVYLQAGAKLGTCNVQATAPTTSDNISAFMMNTTLTVAKR